MGGVLASLAVEIASDLETDAALFVVGGKWICHKIRLLAFGGLIIDPGVTVLGMV